MAKTDLPSPEYLRQILDYDPDTGVLTWKRRDDVPQRWNTKHVGKRAFTCIDGRGYPMGRISGKAYLAHRVAFALLHGSWPTMEVDHINGDKTDFRACNLREVSRVENCRNFRFSKANTSGFTGVYSIKGTGRWVASIGVNGKQVHLGVFDSVEEAANARAAANKEYGFRARQGAV